MAENITNKNILKSWFQRGLKPLASQFAAWMDSYWHKDEKIPMASVERLEDSLNSKAEVAETESLRETLTTHTTDILLHKTQEEHSKLEHLADNPDLTYATKEELESQGAIIVPVDFTITYNERIIAIRDYVKPYVDDGTFFQKPVYAQIRWKSSYTDNENAHEYILLLSSSPEVSSSLIGYIFETPERILDIDYQEASSKYNISICVSVRTKSIAINIGIPQEKVEWDRTIFLQENGDGQISRSEASWKTKFRAALDMGLTPAVYLKTPNTENYIPTSYEFTLNTELDAYIGNMRIQYLKVVDGKRQLWIEDRNFTEASGGLKGLASRYEVPEGGIITKIPLEPEIHVVTEYPADLSVYPDGSIFIKQTAES